MRVIIALALVLLLGATGGCYSRRTLVEGDIIDQPAPAPRPARPSSRAASPAIQFRAPLTLPDSNAEEFLVNRLKQHGLPGLPPATAGTLESGLKVESASAPLPTTRTFRFTKTGDANTYIYTVEQIDRAPGWRITRALQVDPNGKILKEFPLE